MDETDKKVTDKYFIPIEDTEELSLPASYTEPSETLDSSELASFTLKPSRIRFLKPFLKMLALTLAILVGWELFQFVQDVAQWHWSLGYIAIGLLVILFIMFLLVILSYQRNQRELKTVYKFQDKARLLQEERTFGQSKAFIRDLVDLYEDKPQEQLLKKAIDSLPDYNNDSEVLDHLSQHFFSCLDKRALTVVSRYSQQTGLLVALSPLAIADMILSLWRMLKMVDEISQVYGLRPSLPGRLKLGRRLLGGMALAGASELATDAIADFSTSSAAGIVSSRMAQGIGVGLYVARMGIRTMALCRPVPFEKSTKPKIADLTPAITSFISNKL
ncbi:MAG: TIGR01620 family protein [Gammaproteobacteria bacterium]|nr:MAG: TIGR01620 family protein [Gammaproteobacteria bacterium]